MAKKWHQLEKLDHKALKKLQQERERAARAQKEAEERRKKMLIGAAILFTMVFLAVFVGIMRTRRAERILQEQRAKLKISRVSEYEGKVQHRHIGTWEPLQETFEFDREHSFRVHDDSHVSVILQLDNQVRLSGRTEATVNAPSLSESENVIDKQVVNLRRGELTGAVSLDGRGIMKIQVSNIVVTGGSGLFKVIYDEMTDTGEVVVKNGLVEVNIKDSRHEPIRVSGFYKAQFKEGELGNPTQASVIQYDWR